MMLTFRTENDCPVIEMDAEGLAYLLKGLDRLAEAAPGEELVTTGVREDDGEMIGVTEIILRRVE